jgi:hypothetical protein
MAHGLRLKASLSIIVALLLCATAASTEVIDRVLAVVSGQILTKSDVDAAAAFGTAASLQALIDRVLMLNEVRRVAPAEPAALSVDAELARMRARFQAPAAFAQALATSGIDEPVLRVYAADSLRLASYLEERFSSASQPTDEEVREYLRDHADMTTEPARQRVAADRRQALINAWVAELRRRTDITVLQ